MQDAILFRQCFHGLDSFFRRDHSKVFDFITCIIRERNLLHNTTQNVVASPRLHISKRMYIYLHTTDGTLVNLESAVCSESMIIFSLSD